jgi:hypothetical protein
MKMIKDPNGKDWTKKDLELIEIVRNAKVTRKKAKRYWEKEELIRLHFPVFDEYWNALNKPPLEKRCETCRNYPCGSIKELIEKQRQIVICWIFHGSACSRFVGITKDS